MMVDVARSSGSLSVDTNSVAFRVAAACLPEAFSREYSAVGVALQQPAGLRAAAAEAPTLLVAAQRAEVASAAARASGLAISVCPCDAPTIAQLLQKAFPPIDAVTTTRSFQRAAAYLDRDLCIKHGVAPLEELADGVVVLAVENGLRARLHTLQAIVPRAQVVARVLERDAIKALILQAYPARSNIDAGRVEALEQLDQIVLENMRAGGSAAHIETEIDGSVTVAFRILSRLKRQPQFCADAPSPLRRIGPGFVRTLLNAAHESIGSPSGDTQFFNAITLRRHISGRDVDVRLATVPSLLESGDRSQDLGGSLIIRVAQELTRYTLESFNLSPRSYALISNICTRPGKAVLIVAPSGEGKTALQRAIYTYLRAHFPDMAFREFGSPIEYVMPGLRSTELDPSVDPRTIADQYMLLEPNFIFITEVRKDAWFALAFDMAARVAKLFLTTHLLGALDGVQSVINKTSRDSVAQYLDAVIGIRLLDTVCTCALRRPFANAPGVQAFFREQFPQSAPADVLEHTRVAVAADSRLMDAFRRFKMTPPTHVPEQQVAGCARCQAGVPGLAGRRPVVEVFQITPAISAALSEGQNIYALSALDPEYTPMMVEGLELLQEGAATPYEVLRTLRV